MIVRYTARIVIQSARTKAVKRRDTDLVYSICPGCAQPVDNCACHAIKKAAVPRSDGIVRLSYETKGRKGKGMTLITGLPLSEATLLGLAKRLKQRFGTGGSVKDYVIELQGDHRKQAMEELLKLGFFVRRN